MTTELRPESAQMPIARERLALVEETLSLDKRMVVTGHVRLRSVVEEIVETLRGEVGRETVSVEHVAIDREIEVAPDIRVEGDVTVMPVVEERLVLVKKLFLVEELHVRRKRTLEPVAIEATRRVMRAVVEREDIDTP